MSAYSPTLPPLPFDDQPIARTSKLAIASFLSGIVCCIPLTGTAAIILGAWAIARISQSQGRLDGRPLAIIGIALGVLSLVAWIAIAMGVATILGHTKRNVIDPTTNVMLAVNQKDWAVAGDIFDPAEAPTEAQWETFRVGVSSKLGNFKAMATDLTPAAVFAQTMKMRSPGALAVAKGNVVPLVLPYAFDQGTAMVLFVVEPNMKAWDPILNNEPLKGRVINLIVVPAEGSPIIVKP
jgi:hypothetical protein